MPSETKNSETTLEYEIGDVLPYPISKKKETGNCVICERTFKEHNYMDYFLEPSHVQAIRIFWDSLKLKHDTTEVTLLKLATNTPKNIMSPKEILQKLIDVGYNPRMTDWIPQIAAHYIPSEKLDYKHRSITVKLHTARIHYDGFTMYWENDFLRHKQLSSNTEKTVERALELAVTQPLYKVFLETHALDAEIDYRFVQKELHQIAARVNANLKLTKEYAKDARPLEQAGIATAQKSQESTRDILSSLVRSRRYPPIRDDLDRRQQY